MPEDTQTAPKKQSSLWEIPATWEDVRGGISSTSDGIVAWGRATERDIQINRVRFAESIGIRPESVVTLEQVHGADNVRVFQKDTGSGFLDPATRLPATDGSFTSESGLVLMTSHADCAPIFLYLPSKHAIGLVHAGWRGTLAGIAAGAARKLCREFDANPEDIYIAVGPMISTVSYEVGADVAAEFVREFGETVVAKVQGKSYLDVFAAIIVDLLRAGVKSARFCPRPPNTFSDPRWSSFRRDGDQAGGMLAYFRLL
ncbi:MAG: laccase domain-containing protein [Calditrichaeota bacterium]|nr:laccase domain-containing protein [Calditrichota bacterium]MCB9368014.1 laccase domain-containing protein [Calditrichota bacterium]